MEIEKVNIQEFKIEDLPRSCTFLVFGPPGSGKTTFMENLCYYLRHVYPVARMFIGTPSSYKRFCKICHPLFVSNHYNNEEERSHINRQNLCITENVCKNSSAINILDDVTDDPRIFKLPEIRGLFKLGSQHWNQLAIIGSQYSIDFPPDVRKNASYVAIFREPDETERKKLYDNYGGIVGTYDKFCDLMDQITGDYTCMIVVKRTQSNKLEDCVFWYKTKKLEDWKFGCREYRHWGKERYNKSYIDTII